MKFILNNLHTWQLGLFAKRSIDWHTENPPCGLRRLPGDHCGRVLNYIVSRIQRDYETNDVSAAENPIRGDLLLTICSFQFLNIKLIANFKI
jgi:hypothetical protein